MLIHMYVCIGDKGDTGDPGDRGPRGLVGMHIRLPHL